MTTAVTRSSRHSVPKVATRRGLVRLAGEISRSLAPIGRIAVDGEVHSAKRGGSHHHSHEEADKSPGMVQK